MRKNRSTIERLLIGAALLLTAPQAGAGWWDDLFGGSDSAKQQIEEAKSRLDQNRERVRQLSDSDLATGLKQTLENGVGHAVETLGTTDGFLKNQRVSIPLPDRLRRMDKALRKIGQGKYADQFVVTLNRAAEAAVPQTADVLKDSIRQMTFADARQIVQGPDDAATRYLQKTGAEQLRSKITPIVKNATDTAGATRAYKTILDKLSFMSSYVRVEDYDIDRYITDKTLDGLFTLIAEQEKRIREDPRARTTQLLKDVFR